MTSTDAKTTSLTKSQQNAVAHIDGPLLVLAGPGSGKTTALRLLAGFENPDSGSIEMHDRIVFDQETTIPPEDRNIGMVFQDYALFPHLNVEKNISPNLVEALKYGKIIGNRMVGVVGRDGGYTAKVADACVIIPEVNKKNITPHTETFQAVVWHLIVSHPKLKLNETKWESVLKK